MGERALPFLPNVRAASVLRDRTIDGRHAGIVCCPCGPTVRDSLRLTILRKPYSFTETRSIEDIPLFVPSSLHSKQLSIEAIPTDEIIVGALVSDRTLAKHDDPVRHSHRGEPVRD